MIKMKVKVKEHLKAPPHHQHRYTETQQPNSSYVTWLEKTACQTTQEMGKHLWGSMHIIEKPNVLSVATFLHARLIMIQPWTKGIKRLLNPATNRDDRRWNRTENQMLLY